MAVVIQTVEEHSPAHKAGIRPGEMLVSINGHSIRDVLDYRFYMTDANLQLELNNSAGSPYTVTIKKEEYQDLGLDFETYLMDKQQSCKNKCVFCFIDQMPKGMRKTLYFKDDDSRMSFLFGNYITLTNLEEEDIERIIKMRISPINISVHTTNPELRVKMMANPKSGESLRYIKMLTDAGIRVNTQIVLCPGLNDGEELRRSLSDLCALYPNLQSVAVVPVGITKFRDGLYPLRCFTREEARQTIALIEEFSARMLAEHGERVVYPSDEFFLEAELPIPQPEYYGGFDQLEDGVGLMALLKEEFFSALEEENQDVCPKQLSVATGKAAAGLIKELAEQAMRRFPQLNISVYTIENRYFGPQITVAGLVTGTDLMDQLNGKPLGEKLLIPSVMLRHEQDRFLDDITVEELENKLNVPLQAVANDGYELLAAMTGQN